MTILFYLLIGTKKKTCMNFLFSNNVTGKRESSNHGGKCIIFVPIQD